MRTLCKFIFVMLLPLAALLTGCSKSLTSEEKEQVASLQRELSSIRTEIDAAKADDAKLAGGLIKVLIGVRLEVLKTNEALIQQRVHAIEGRSTTQVVVKTTSVDTARAAELAQELDAQRKKLAEAKAESDQYAGGLIKALAESAVATVANTIAMLEQQRVIAKYGLALPQTPAATATAETVSAKPVVSPRQAPPTGIAKECLKIETYDSSTLSSNSSFTEIAWKVDVSNACPETFDVKVIFKLSDKDEFELDTDTETLRIGGNSTGKARGKMLVSPPEKARRIAKQGVSLRY